MPLEMAPRRDLGKKLRPSSSICPDKSGRTAAPCAKPSLRRFPTGLRGRGSRPAFDRYAKGLRKARADTAAKFENWFSCLLRPRWEHLTKLATKNVFDEAVQIKT